MIAAHPRYSTLATLLANFITKVSAAQSAYYAAHGAYFQGLRVPAADLTGTTDADADWTTHPHDQAATYAAFDGTTFTAARKVPFNVRIDVYEAPAGWGWLLTVELWYAGLGPDAYGRDGSHWIYRHHEGADAPAHAILDEWYIEPAEG